MKHQRRCQFKKKDRKQYIAPLSNFDILDLVVKLKIPYFRGVFMRDTLPKMRPAVRECWILNQASSTAPKGSHWCGVVKCERNIAFYFDPMGRIAPPLEVLNYLQNDVKIYYNTKRYQNYGTTICGHLCLRFLYDFWRKWRKK